jgi:glycosyltransferase involved in cell wall biosynthesis
MKKIVFISSNETVTWGGSEPCWSLAAERLVRAGFEVHVSVKDWGTRVEQIENLRSAGCRVFYRRFPPQIQHRFKRWFSRTDYRRLHLRSIGRDSDLVVVAQGGNNDGADWIDAANAEGLRYAVISQSANEQWWPHGDFARRLSNGFSNACRAYFVSQANLDLTRLQYSIPLQHGQVVRNPFNVRYEANPSWPGDAGKTLSLGCMARLFTVQKGQDLLIQVLARPHWRARNIRVTFAGSGVHENQLRAMVSRFNLQNIEFAGYIEDIEAFWSCHHALVLPSRFEGMPLALVEAMLCHRASVVTDVAGHRELVRDNINGFLAKAPTVDLLDEALNCAWENRSRLRDMGETAAQDVRQWVSPDPTGDFVRDLQSLVNGHKQ